jgi:hypothetical protein
MGDPNRGEENHKRQTDDVVLVQTMHALLFHDRREMKTAMSRGGRLRAIGAFANPITICTMCAGVKLRPFVVGCGAIARNLPVPTPVRRWYKEIRGNAAWATQRRN